uniref:Uncharacterized protein n=1 Tax=Clytia hemisphaerica TaxID=252671 RepID=A0A7M5XF55_9CNID|eukprot:TCONS_00050885-protein
MIVSVSPRKEIASYFDLASPKILDTEPYIKQYKIKQRTRSTDNLLLERTKEEKSNKPLKAQLRLSFHEDINSFCEENQNFEVPSPSYYQSLSDCRNHQKFFGSHVKNTHARTLSARETRRPSTNHRQKFTNQKSFDESLANRRLYKIRKSQSVDELERSPVSPIKEHESFTFDSKLKIKPINSSRMEPTKKESSILTQRMTIAEEKKTKRMLLMKALDKDCLKAQELIAKLKLRFTSQEKPDT